jgi:ribosomal-protein-alanine N-acetyltransferase
MITPHIRWMIRRDMPSVLAIESQSFEYSWTEDDFIRCLRQRNCIGMVAEQDDRIVGFMIYKLHKNRLHVLNFAVAAEYRRQGIGAAMVTKLASKLSTGRRDSIGLEVSEANLPGQLFFKSQGFRAVSVIRDFYDNGDAAYRMRLRHSDTFADLGQGESLEVTR